MKKLFALVADEAMRVVLKILLERRYPSLGIVPMQEGKDFDIRAHANRDAGVRVRAVEFLRPRQRDYRYALILFDHEGSSAEDIPPEELEQRLEQGWRKAAGVTDAPSLSSRQSWKRGFGAVGPM